MNSNTAEYLNCSGIYFLASRYLDGSYIYKVGKAGCIRDRINQYPQNFDLILQFECSNNSISEKEVIRVVANLENIGITKCVKGSEYFRSEENMVREIKLAIYEWYYEIERTRTIEFTRTREITRDEIIEEEYSKPKGCTRETNDANELEIVPEYVFESELKEGILKSDDVKYSVWEDKNQRNQKTHMFFTWSDNNSRLTKTKIRDFLERELTVYNINYVIVSERCKSGKEYFHAVVTGCRIFNLTDKDRFNIYEEGKCHVPYVLFPKKYSDVEHLIWYMQKEDKDPIYKGYKKQIYLDANIYNPYPYLKSPPENKSLVKRLEEVAKYNSKNNTLVLESEYWWDDDDFIYIINNLSDKVENLSIIGGGLKIPVMEKLMIGLNQTNVKSLSISNIILAWGSIKILIKYLIKYREKIKSLDLINMRLNYNHIKYIFRYINSTGIEKLDLSKNDMCMDCIIVISNKTSYSSLNVLTLKGLSKLSMLYLKEIIPVSCSNNIITITKNNLNISI